MQFLIGNNLQSCRDALASQERSALHLLERTSINFQVQSSIVPKYPSISRLIISGNLTGLQVNVSDVKYKSLMRLIDVCIPNFDDDEDIPKPLSTAATKADASTFRLSPTLFRRGEGEYHVEEDQEQHEQYPHLEGEMSTTSPKLIFEPDAIDIQVPDLSNSAFADIDATHPRHSNFGNP
jgi:vacuolar protein sorting-associated protein 13A/C